MHSTFDVQTICATKQWIELNTIPSAHSNVEILQVSPEDLQRMSSLSTPNNVLAVVSTPKPQAVRTQDTLVLALDGINNPGNLGTIIRQALWFGLTDIVCSSNTVSIYNPKSIQATMGALFWVNVIYCELPDFIRSLPPKYNIYGTIVDSDNNIYQQTLSNEGLIIIGSESHGISPQVRRAITTPLTIPNYSPDGRAESLNASIATAIVLSEFKRSVPDWH